MNLTINRRVVKLSRLDKVFWPEDGYTKGDLIKYYIDVSKYLLPYLFDRPLSLTRYPDGIRGKWFYQKNKPAYAPKWLSSFPYAARKGSPVTNYCLCNDLESLVWLVNQACLEIHPWFSRKDRVDYPDFAVFDLDPMPPATFRDAVEVAQLLKEVLAQFELLAVVKTSGATGLHIYVPLERRYTYREVQLFIRYIGGFVLKVYPEKVSLYERWVKDRAGKVYIDYLQNNRGQTVAAPYCVRPIPGAPVSAPITWEELPRIAPGQFTIRTMPERLARVGDLFAGVYAVRQNITPLLKRAEQQLAGR